MNKSKHRKGIIAVIVDSSDNFLLVQLKGRGKGDWNFPGGGLKPNESFEDCLWREMAEEVGLSKGNFELIGKSKNVDRYEYNPKLLEQKRKQGSPYIGQEKHQFVLRLIDDKNDIKINEEEFLDYKWVTFQELKTYLLFPGQYDKAVEVIKELIPEIIGD